MIPSTHRSRRRIPAIFGAAAIAALVIVGGWLWYANTEPPLELAQLGDDVTVTTAPVTEDTPGPILHEGDNPQGVDRLSPPSQRDTGMPPSGSTSEPH